MRHAISGKHILLVAPVSYQYHRLIHNQLKKLAASVTFHGDYSEGLLQAMCKRLGVFNQLNTVREQALVQKLKNSPLDIVLVFRGATLSQNFLINLKEQHADACFILYQWDSLKNNTYEQLIPFFDYVASFDPVDCKTLDIDYLPLFYAGKGGPFRENQKNQDLVFIGAYTEERRDFVQKIERLCTTKQIRLHTFFFIPLLAYLKLFFQGRILPSLHFRRLEHATSMTILTQSHCVLDFHHKDQSGLTMRTIEAIALGCKLVTCNKSIRDEPFYDPACIQVIDPAHPELDLEWMQAPNATPVMNFLRLDNWLEKLINKALETKAHKVKELSKKVG
ncbi:MAG: hypothetical protein JKY88_04625 [Pseudomonadales bacterium]|nr:hypothetical protein [Pseudomonadales bacterium]